ncbi:MAG: acetolactate synthase large subunit [Candidatus Dojkabacteria bacterium]
MENEYVEYIFGIAGEENLDLLEALSTSSIKYIPVRHEQAAGFMAATVGRLTGHPGVCLSTLGPGATNLITAIAYAKLGAMPMLAITGQKPLHNNLQGNFQIVDIVNLMRPITELTSTIISENKIPSIIRESFRTAIEERPGPVHIELPKDIARNETIKEPIKYDPKVRRPIAEEKAITKAVEMINNSENPVILIGAGANRKRTSKMLTEFIQKTGIYFVDTQMGKGVVDERNGKFLGTAVRTSGDKVHKAIENADLIINVGHDIIEKSPFIMRQDSTQKVLHINFFGAQVNETYFPHLEVIGDIANAIWQIKEQISKNFHSSPLFEKIKQEVKNEEAHELSFVKKDAEKILPIEIIQQLRAHLGAKDILALDNGMYKLWFARFYMTYCENTLLLDNALATMGAGLPSGIAAKLIYPDRKVVTVSGDGGFMMNSQELETAVRLGVDLTVLILNDNALGMIEWEQKEKNFKEFGLKHSNPDFVKYAESYGAKGFRAKNAEHLNALLEEVLDSKGVNLIEIQVDYSRNLKMFNQNEIAK